MSKRRITQAKSFHDLFTRLEELVLANSGVDEFEEIFKLVFAKLYDELYCNNERFHTNITEEETLKNINSLLSDAISEWPGIFSIVTKVTLEPGHAAVCIDYLERFSLSGSGLQVMDDAFEHLTSKASKGSKGQFFTPRHVIDFCIKLLDPKPTDSICDPACGSGGFLFHALDYVKQSSALEQISDNYSANLWGFDFESKASRVAKALMLVSGAEKANIYRVNSLYKNTQLGFTLSSESNQLSIEDLIKPSIPTFNGFDIILTNPPYAGEVKENSILQEYAVSKIVGHKVERDTLFIERCLGLLRPGGKMAIVIPDNKVSSQSFEKLRLWINSQAQILAVVGLPRSTFMPHTSQKTSILFLRKRESNEKPNSNEQIFFGISENIGKDSRGRIIYKNKKEKNQLGTEWSDVDHDLDLILKDYFLYEEVQNGSNI